MEVTRNEKGMFLMTSLSSGASSGMQGGIGSASFEQKESQVKAGRGFANLAPPFIVRGIYLLDLGSHRPTPTGARIPVAGLWDGQRSSA